MGIHKILGIFGQSGGDEQTELPEAETPTPEEDHEASDASNEQALRREPDGDSDSDPAEARRGGSHLELFDDLAIDWTPSEIDLVYSAFDASQPAENPANLSGRDKELGKLLSGILYRRNHGIIAGPRGSGKTSLARVLGHLAEKQGTTVVYSSCSAGTTFGQLMRELLEQVPYALVQPDMANAFEMRVSELNSSSNASQVVKALSLLTYSQLIFVVDEYDRIDDPHMHGAIASVMKIISDRRLPVRLLLAGAVETLSQIVDEHPSLLRNLTEVETNPLSPEQVDKILDACADECQMAFAKASKTLIHEVSCGSPYHARLFGMHAALGALREGKKLIKPEHASEGLVHSFEEWAAFNKEDARIFLGIAEGWNGSPSDNFALARSFAAAKVGETLLETHSSLEDNRPETRDKALAAFGSSIKKTGSEFVFRDTTAPQFLLALKYMPSSFKAKSHPKNE